ncbi:MAG TPA: hypothetical protein VGE20_16635 [Ramlibacter sp.]
MSSTVSQAGTVNTNTDGEQTARAIAALADGGYAVAWAGAGDGGLAALQRFDAAGMKVGPETTLGLDLRQHPDAALAVLGDGSVVVAYTALRSVPRDGYSMEVSSVFAQRFDATGQPLGGAFEVGSLTHSSLAADYKIPLEPGLLTWPDGSWAVTWDVAAVRDGQETSVTGALASFDSRGEPVGRGARLFGGGEPGAQASFATLPDGGLLFVEQYVAGAQTFVRFSPSDSQERTSTVATAADGSALPSNSILLALDEGYVLWSSEGAAPYLQLLDASGAPVGSPTPMAHLPHQAQALAGGGFVLLWPMPGQDASGTDLVAQRFDAAGIAVGGEQRVDTNGGEALVTALSDGGWALAWTAIGADGSLDVFTQRFADGEDPSGPPAPADGDADGNAAGPARGEAIVGLAGDELLHGSAGDDTVDGGAGTDTFVTDASLASVHGFALADGVLTLTTASGTDTLMNVERVRLADSLFAFDTQAPAAGAEGGHVWQAAALYRAASGMLPGQRELSRWTAQADEAGDFGALAQRMVDAYAPGVSSADLVAHLYRSLVGTAPDDATVQALASHFATGGAALAFAATLSLNTDQMVGFAGSVQQLDPAWF